MHGDRFPSFVNEIDGTRSTTSVQSVGDPQQMRDQLPVSSRHAQIVRQKTDSWPMSCTSLSVTLAQIDGRPLLRRELGAAGRAEQGLHLDVPRMD